jgi:thioesterase domain-containing protein
MRTEWQAQLTNYVSRKKTSLRIAPQHQVAIGLMNVRFWAYLRRLPRIATTRLLSRWNQLMTASPAAEQTRNTNVLFARVSRNSGQVILPINDSARGGDPKIPAFYCVHSVSGAAGTDFLDLAQRLDPAVRFYGIQAPPKQMDDERFGRTIESMAAQYADALVEFQPSGQFVLGGYCVGAVVALAMAKNLRTRGRGVGPLIAIDGAPENTGPVLHRWTPRYLLELARNLRGWIVHADLIRSRSVDSLIWSISNNASAIAKGIIGLKRGQKLGGGYSISGIMDVSRYAPAQKSFINRLIAALFSYVPTEYSGDVVVYEAKVTRLLYLSQIGRMWSQFAPQSEIVHIVGTHISMMREPYVDALANDLRRRIAEFFSVDKS